MKQVANAMLKIDDHFKYFCFQSFFLFIKGQDKRKRFCGA